MEEFEWENRIQDWYKNELLGQDMEKTQTYFKV